jgi:predicted dehydrogenase
VGTGRLPVYRVGIVGAGGIARAHARACRELEIVILCTWGVHHAETGIRVAQSRRVKAILCEKPFTANAAEAERLLAAARENGVLIAEALKFRHHPMHLHAKELADAGRVPASAASGCGEVVTLRSTFCIPVDAAARRPEKNWRRPQAAPDRAQGGGALYDLGCYAIHHARWIFDAEPVRVFAAAQPGSEVEDAASVLLVVRARRSTAGNLRCRRRARPPLSLPRQSAAGALPSLARPPATAPPRSLAASTPGTRSMPRSAAPRECCAWRNPGTTSTSR